MSTEDLLSVLSRAATEAPGDVHLVAGSGPHWRRGGRLERLDLPPVTQTAMEALAEELLEPDDHQLLLDEGRCRAVVYHPRLGRVRGDFWIRRDQCSMTLRLLPKNHPPLEALGELERLKEVLGWPRPGLFLVTGPSGSGVTTTLTALADYLNRSYRQHLMTVGETIEYLLPHKLSMISQRCVSSDCESWREALKSALDLNVDTLLLDDCPADVYFSEIGDLVDAGTLILLGLRADGIQQAVERLVDRREPVEQSWSRQRLGRYFLGASCQRWLLSATGRRLLVTEMMAGRIGVQTLIHEGKTHQFYSVMQADKGSHTEETSLMRLVRRGELGSEEALAASRCPDELRRLLEASV